MATKQVQTETQQRFDEEISRAAAAEIEDQLKRGMKLENALGLLGEYQKEATISAQAVDGSYSDELVTLYHNQTGEPHPTPVYMVEKYVRRRFPAESWVPQELWGKPVYSVTPNTKMFVGSYVCKFHPDSPDREAMNDLGLGAVVCGRKGLRTEMALDQHMRSTHRDETATIERIETRKREERLLEMQTRQLEAMVALAQAQGSK